MSTLTTKPETSTDVTSTTANNDAAARRPVYAPTTDIYQLEDHYLVVADVPGATEDTIDITIERNVLTISATSQVSVPEGMKPVYREYRAGDYRRSFTLGNTIDRNRVEASYTNGVLTLKLPLAQEAQPRRIPVTTN